MDIRTVTYPTVAAILPVELNRIKTFLRIEQADEDLDLQEYYITAAAIFEKMTGRGVFTTSRRMAFPRWVGILKSSDMFTMQFTGQLLELPYPLLIAVQSVQYYDSTETLQTLDPSYYTVATLGDIGRVILLPNGLDVMSSLSLVTPNPIVINYTSGFGADTSTVPLGIKQWLRECTKWLYSVKGRDSFDGVPDYLQHMAGMWHLGKVW